jgi:hypothetical protein
MQINPKPLKLRPIQLCLAGKANKKPLKQNFINPHPPLTIGLAIQALKCKAKMNVRPMEIIRPMPILEKTEVQDFTPKFIESCKDHGTLSEQIQKLRQMNADLNKKNEDLKKENFEKDHLLRRNRIKLCRMQAELKIKQKDFQNEEAKTSENNIGSSQIDYDSLLYDLQQMAHDQPEMVRGVIPEELFRALANSDPANINLNNPSQINPDAMTYEQLLELEERMGKVSKGLTTTQIKV